MKYVACYCRVSSEEQVKFGFSIEAQKDALEKYCKENNYKYEFYIDEGISASSMKRPALQNMLKKSNIFDMILFTKLDRLSRNVLDANNINRILKENHCNMKAIDEDDIDTSTADGMFMFNLRVSLAQREIEKTSERIQFVFNNKRSKGEVTSGTKRYGYDIIDKKYQVNEEEAENLRNLYKYYIEVNGNPKKVYTYFVQHFTGKGQDALYSYLRDTSYIGKYKLYRKNIYLENYIPRIMEDELFYSVQNLLKKRGKYHTHAETLFTGLLYCKICDKKFHKKVDYRVKTIVVRYGCDRAVRYIPGTLTKKCSNNLYVREDYIEKYLLNNLKTEAEKYIAKIQIKKKEKKTLDNSKELKNINKKLEKLKDLYLDDLIDKKDYEKDYLKYKEKLAELQKQNTTKDEPLPNLEHLNKLINSDIEKIYNSLDQSQKRRFWLSIIDKIYIEKGKVKEVIFL